MALFTSEPQPVWGRPYPAADGIRRIVAPNPSPARLHGTNTYLVDLDGGCAVFDPGPEIPEHLDAIVQASLGRVSLIVLTHSHLDHAEGAAALALRTSAPVAAYVPQARDIRPPDICIADGEVIAGMVAIHAPGHASDHLCFARDGVMLTGDNVMAWAGTGIRPPDGDMAAYLKTLRMLLDRQEQLCLPGHGPAVTDPGTHIRALLDRRLAQEDLIVTALSCGPLTVAEIVSELYPGRAANLLAATEALVLAHMRKLAAEQAIEDSEGNWTLR